MQRRASQPERLSDEVRALWTPVRGRDGLVRQHVALANQLRSLLDSFRPGAAAVFAALDSPIALALLDPYSTPGSAARLSEKRMAAFLTRNSDTGRRSPAELLARLRAAPAGLAADVEADSESELVRALTAAIERLAAEIARLSACIAHAVRVLARAWVRVLWTVWQTGTPNDPAQHKAAARLAA